MNARHVLATALAVAAVAAIGFGAYRFGMNRGMQSAEPATRAASEAAPKGAADPAAGRRVLYWYDPMYPDERFDKPGKSPRMDMPLVPVYADEGGDAGTVTISPRVQQNLGIRTAEVVRGSLATTVEAVGSVAYNERDVAVVQARSAGFVEKLYVRAPLDPVRRGQALAELYVPDWVAAQEEFLSAKRIAAQTDISGLASLVDGARQRMRLAGMTEEQVRIVEENGKVSPRITLTAPIGGVIVELGAREGMTVAAGAPLFRINGLGTVWVNAEVPEAMAAQVRPGVTVHVRTSAFPGETFNGRVSAILPEVNPATRTLKARVEVANPRGKLVPGMFAAVAFAPSAARQALLVPSEAVIQTGTRSVVMLAQEGGRFAPVDVQTGMEANGQVEILKGLEAGQKVVVSGQFLVDSEASLKATGTRMGEGSAPAPESPATPAPGSPAAPATHHGSGVVEQVTHDSITISHGPVPTMQWPAMTMAFAVPHGMPVKAKVGDRVSFDFRQAPGGKFELTRIEPAP